MRTPRRTTIALVSGASVIAALAACSDAAATGGTTADDASTSTLDDGATVTEAEPAPADPDASGYTDGTYTESGSYQSPAGEESVQVSVNLEGGIIKAVEVTPDATNPQSKQYQTAFASGIADEVVGKSITDADVDVVSGSSLTSEGFNAALAQIAADAQA